MGSQVSTLATHRTAPVRTDPMVVYVVALELTEQTNQLGNMVLD